MASSCGVRWSGMGRPEGTEAVLAVKFQVLLPHLDERQRRLAIGAEALSLGHGGIRIVAAAAGVREATVSCGAAELDSGQAPLGRVRHPGGGRKKAAELDSGLRPALLALVEPDERGDPMSPLRWTTKSTRKLAAELTRQGHRVSADTVAGLLRDSSDGDSTRASAPHPQRPRTPGGPWHRRQTQAHLSRPGPRHRAPPAKLATMDLLGQLFNTTAMTISRAAKDVRPILEAHGVHIPASTARSRTPTDIARYLDLDKNKIKPTC